MRGWEEQIALSVPVEAAFAYVSDFTRHGEWSSHHLKATQIGGGPLAVGATYATSAKQFGTQRERSTVTDMVTPSLFGWDSVGALGRVHHAFTIREEDGGTVLVKSARFLHRSLLARVMTMRLRRDIPKGLRGDLVKIKARLEG